MKPRCSAPTTPPFRHPDRARVGWLLPVVSAAILVAFAAVTSTCSVIARPPDKTGGGADREPAARSDGTAPGVAPVAAAPLTLAIRELDERIVGLPPDSPLDFPAAVFDPIDRMLEHARVVGLGEATHGSAEFVELKHRLVRHLVEVHGHRALGYELSFAASLAIDRWVTTGEGSLDDLLAGLSWIQANQEVRALLVWLRQHNRDLPAPERVRFIGIDSQLDMWNLDRDRTIFRDRFPGLERELRRDFDELAALGRIDYRTLTADQSDRISRRLATMASIVDRRSSDLSREDRLVARHLIDAVARSHEFLLSAYQGANDVRDRHLADNALWIGELLGDGVGYTVWAHDSHVATNPYYYRDTGPGSMGDHLSHRLGDAYVQIATAFTRGSFVAVQADWRGRDTAPMICRIDVDPPSDSINALLDRASSNRYLLPLRGIPTGSPLNRFLDAERPMLGVGDFFAGTTEPHYRSPERVLRLLDAYDAIFYFTDTRGVHPLPPAGSP